MEILRPFYQTGKQEDPQNKDVIVFNDQERFNKRKEQHYDYNIPKISPYEYITEYCGNQYFNNKNDYADKEIGKTKC